MDPGCFPLLDALLMLFSLTVNLQSLQDELRRINQELEEENARLADRLDDLEMVFMQGGETGDWGSPLHKPRTSKIRPPGQVVAHAHASYVCLSVCLSVCSVCIL